MQQLREVEVQALPLDMPSELTADLAMIAEPADVIRVSGLNVPPTVTLITDSEEAVARFAVAREEAAEEAAPAKGEAEQETPAGDEG